jgi:hypothetical protein
MKDSRGKESRYRDIEIRLLGPKPKLTLLLPRVFRQSFCSTQILSDEGFF